MNTVRKTTALIVAAGRGSRAGAGLPKQYRQMPDGNGETVLARTLSAFHRHPSVSGICTVIHNDDVEHYKDSIKALNLNDNHIHCFGGETRQQSVLNGLNSLLENAPDNVLIHDAARPYISQQLISQCIDGLNAHQAVIPALPVTDTLKRAENGAIRETVSRDGLWRAQTPQAFHFDAILAAHQAAQEDLTDDAALAEMAEIAPIIITGDDRNIKLTHEKDFAMSGTTAPQFLPRTGNGFDVHRFGEVGTAEAIMLGGISISHDREIIGHSDADVGLHAITDALYGALAEGDIGDHFPPNDDSNKDRASAEFLRHAVELATQKAARITHIDLTLICEAPKIGPHRDAIRAAIAAITAVPIGAISVKATTTEKLGFTGRGEGIAAQATVTLIMPESD